MKHNKNDVGISASIETFINLHAKKLIRSRYFLPGELEDIKQDLWLYYYEKLYPKGEQLGNDFIFISIKGEAQHILRARLKDVQAGFFFSETLNSMYEDTLFNAETTHKSDKNIDDMVFTEEIKSKLNDKERKAVELVLEGYTSREIAKMLHISDHFLNRLGEKMKNTLKS